MTTRAPAVLTNGPTQVKPLFAKRLLCLGIIRFFGWSRVGVGVGLGVGGVNDCPDGHLANITIISIFTRLLCDTSRICCVSSWLTEKDLLTPQHQNTSGKNMMMVMMILYLYTLFEKPCNKYKISARYCSDENIFLHFHSAG